MQKLTYQLNAEEIEESWMSAHWRMEVFQKWNQVILAVLGVGLMLVYASDPQKFYLILCAGLVVILLFYNSYFAAFSRRRKARRAAKEKGIYGIQFTERGLYAGKDWKFYSLEEKKWELLDSENVYTIKTGAEIFCVPKRVLDEGGTQSLEGLRDKGHCNYKKIITGKE